MTYQLQPNLMTHQIRVSRNQHIFSIKSFCLMMYIHH